MELQVGDLCKHFKGRSLLEKNIYEIVATNAIYTGENTKEPLDDLVIYKNIFQEGKMFVREYKDLVEELAQEKQHEYGQMTRIQKLTEEEIELVRSEPFQKEKLSYMERQK